MCTQSRGNNDSDIATPIDVICSSQYSQTEVKLKDTSSVRTALTADNYLLITVAKDRVFASPAYLEHGGE